MSKSLIFLMIVIISCIHMSNACYITNCPWGGKRSLEASYFDESFHQCRKCANGEGTCFGPRICCGPEIGCLLDTKETFGCRLEDTKTSAPCVPYGKTCSKLSYGRCATKNLCCNPEQCVSDSSCSYDNNKELEYNETNEESSSELNNKEKKLSDRKLLELLNRLIEKKHRSETENLTIE